MLSTQFLQYAQVGASKEAYASVYSCKRASTLDGAKESELALNRQQSSFLLVGFAQASTHQELPRLF